MSKVSKTDIKRTRGHGSLVTARLRGRAVTREPPRSTFVLPRTA